VTDKLADLYRKPGHLLRRAQQVIVGTFTRECAEYDLTPVQYAALTAIRFYPGTDATRLAEMIAFDRSTIGNVLIRLEKKGLIRRDTHESDKRIKTVSLTSTGLNLVIRADPIVDQVQEKFLAPLTKQEAAEFIRLLHKLADVREITRD